MKKLVALLTVVLISIVFFAGCGVCDEIFDSNTTSKQDSSSTPKQESTTSKQMPTTTTTEPYDDYWPGFGFQYGFDSDGNVGPGIGLGGFNVVTF